MNKPDVIHQILGERSALLTDRGIDQLTAYLNMLDRSEQKKEAITAEQVEIYRQVKNAGFDVPVVKKMIRSRINARKSTGPPVKKGLTKLDIYESAVAVPDTSQHKGEEICPVGRRKTREKVQITAESITFVRSKDQIRGRHKNYNRI